MGFMMRHQSDLSLCSNEDTYNIKGTLKKIISFDCDICDCDL